MEPDWAQQISKKAWTEHLTHKHPQQDPEDYDSHCPCDVEPHCSSSFWPEWLGKWLQNSGLILRRLHRYTELKEM